MNRGAIAMLIVGFLLAWGCGGEDDSSSSSGNAQQGCAWHGNCSSRAPEGGYDCSGNTLMRCVGGQWQSVTYCGSHTWTSGSGFTYSCSCKGGCGTNEVVCSYAFNTCGGQRYETCGPNAHSEISGGSWKCVPG